MARSPFFDISALPDRLPFLRRSRRHRRRPLSVLPIVSVMPGENVWFLRFAFAFLAHLAGGGSIVDELTGDVVGDPAGRRFNYDHVRGGPVMWAPRLVPSGHLFVGQSVCPGFQRLAAQVAWWRDTAFCGRGYDYFSDGYNYAHVPVDLAPHAYAEVAFAQLDEAAWHDPRQRSVLLPTEPIEQAVRYFNLRRKHPLPLINTMGGRPLSSWSFEDYLFGHALRSYAKILVSYQEMARQRPDSVGILPFHRVEEDPQAALAAVLDRLSPTPQAWPHLPAAIALARGEHLAAVEKALGRSLDWRRPTRTAASDEIAASTVSARLHREARAALVEMGVDPQLLPAAPVAEPPVAEPMLPRRAGGPA